MPSYYTVVQYLPDAIRDERVNIGVIVYDERGADIRSQFVRDWQRVRNFAGGEIDFLRQFADEIGRSTAAQQVLPIDGQVRELTIGAIEQMAGRWINTIQLTQPRASLASPSELLPSMATQFLAPVVRRSRRDFRDRRPAVTIARRSLEAALAAVPQAKRKKVTVATKLTIAGQLDRHLLDVGLKNGSPLLGIRGMSFEGPSGSDLQREVDATAWAIDDIHESNPTIKIGVVVLPPRKGGGKTYETARRVLSGLGADVVEEADVAAWTADVTQKVLN